MDWGFDDEFDGAGDNSRPPDRELVPEGEHDFSIRDVIDHGEKVEIRLAPAERGYGWVFCHFPKKASWCAPIWKSLAAAVGMTRDEWKRATRDDLVGRDVRARIYHKAGQNKTFVNVGEFMPARPQVERATAAPVVERAVAPPAARVAPQRPTRSQAADRAGNAPDDDIPF